MEKNKIKSIYAIGEIVFDIMFKNGQPVAARPGGSMLNSSISLGRSGLPVNFIGTCGNDKTGDLISSFLEENHVGRTFLHRENSKSIIALAFLDENNNASYDFYKGVDTGEMPELPSPGEQDIILFGSFYSISAPTRDTVIRLKKLSSDSGALLFYDPNFRDSHLKALSEVKPFIEANILHSQIVRGSNEDFEIIFGTGSAEATWNLPCFRNCKALIYTRSAKGVDLYTPGFSKHYDVPEIKPLSTIGAGDSFNAGIITAMFETSYSSRNIGSCSVADWDMIIAKGIEFSSVVCMSYDNYIPGKLNSQPI